MHTAFFRHVFVAFKNHKQTPRSPFLKSPLDFTNPKSKSESKELWRWLYSFVLQAEIFIVLS